MTNLTSHHSLEKYNGQRLRFNGIVIESPRKSEIHFKDIRVSGEWPPLTIFFAMRSGFWSEFLQEGDDVSFYATVKDGRLLRPSRVFVSPNITRW